MKKGKTTHVVMERAEKPHAMRLAAQQPGRRIVAEERKAGPGRSVRAYVVEQCDELERIRYRLTAQQYDAALQMRELWDKAALHSRRVIASYNPTGAKGNEEISDGAAKDWARFTSLVAAMGPYSYAMAAIALVCWDEPRELDAVVEGLNRAKRWFGIG